MIPMLVDRESGERRELSRFEIEEAIAHYIYRFVEPECQEPGHDIYHFMEDCNQTVLDLDEVGFRRAG